MFKHPVVLLLCLVTYNLIVDGSHEGETVAIWAQRFGQELWKLGQTITRASEIKARYTTLNAQVEIKDAPKLLNKVVENVSRMMSRKMDAVKCILNASEEAAEHFEFDPKYKFSYYSAKYSNVTGSEVPPPYDYVANHTYLYRNMSFEPDTNFYNIPVNTTYSVVHVPTNVYDLSPEAAEIIQWSEVLDEVFTKNYASDPALSWQYFGSSSGIMRLFPARSWTPDRERVDTYDCRKRSWFIEAATCSKDLIILLDNSGSMMGVRQYIAKVAIHGLLGTLSNNDFVNIFKFADNTSELIPCFQELLVQATPENIQYFHEALDVLKPQGNANFSQAFRKAYDLLEKYRDKRECYNASDCNQGIMLITDSLPGNVSDIEGLNYVIDEILDEETPVRVFTYLIGLEVTNVREIQWMACLNRGYYVHIRNQDEVAGKVLKYIPVIARPLVLQARDHPVTWTHASADVVKNSLGEAIDYRLSISVAVPVFNNKRNRNETVRIADLLGVAAADIPLEDIESLTLPYMLGVNAYSFVVSNNGYLLMHPNMRPVIRKFLIENYNSIDFVEVEQVDDDAPPREYNDIILNLRQKLVMGEKGSVHDVPIRYHFDEMRRITRQKMNYYFAPLHNTPYSIGLALPAGYGSVWINVGDELKKNQHMGVNITKFFDDDNWRVHPNWTYCKYHYIEGHEFKTPEDQLIHFLNKMSDLSTWKWSEQYEADPLLDDIAWGPSGTLSYSQEFNCGRKTHDHDDYYCNRELIQRLVFDSKVVEPFLSVDKRLFAADRLVSRYNVTLRFVATMSGLTRWQYLRAEYEKGTNKKFGDYHAKAIDETWYKSAVLQHEIDSNSFVFSVPGDGGARHGDELLVTASHAIFPRDGGKEAPGSVVGYQFSHNEMKNRLMDISRYIKCRDCSITSCSTGEIDCYVIDSAGYVIISETLNDTGRSFGEIEGAIMETMLNLGIYDKVTVYDFQALCFYKVMISSDAITLLNPVTYAKFLINWIVAATTWIVTEFEISQLFNAVVTFAENIYDDMTEDEPTTTTKQPPPVTVKTKATKASDKKDAKAEADEWFSRKREPIFEEHHKACDKQLDLYILQQSKLIEGGGYSGEVPKNCSRPFFINRIPYTNLLLVVVKSMYQSCYVKLTSTPQIIQYPNGSEPPCHKLNMNDLPRRKLLGCYSAHPLESEIKDCGRGSDVRVNVFLGTFLIVTLLSF